jgi:hypothetical protein
MKQSPGNKRGDEMPDSATAKNSRKTHFALTKPRILVRFQERLSMSFPKGGKLIQLVDLSYAGPQSFL